MIKIFAGLYPTPVSNHFAGLYPTPVSNHLLLKMQIIKVLNPHTRPIKGGTFVRDVCVRLSHEVFGKWFLKTFRGTWL